MEKVSPIINSVDAKILKIMSEIESVPKRGHSKALDYDYVTERDAIDVVRRGVIKHGLVVYTSVVEHDTGYYDAGGGYSTVLMSYLIVDVITGHERTVKFPGSAMDESDKSIYKAITGSMKYFNLKTFLFGGGDDPEVDSPGIDNGTREVSPTSPAGAVESAKSAPMEYKLDSKPTQYKANKGPATAYKPGVMHIGKITGNKFPEGSKPGSITISLPEGDLKVSYFNTPSVLHGLKNPVGIVAQIMFVEKIVKGVTYKNLDLSNSDCHFALEYENAEDGKENDSQKGSEKALTEKEFYAVIIKANDGKAVAEVMSLSQFNVKSIRDVKPEHFQDFLDCLESQLKRSKRS